MDEFDELSDFFFAFEFPTEEDAEVLEDIQFNTENFVDPL